MDEFVILQLPSGWIAMHSNVGRKAVKLQIRIVTSVKVPLDFRNAFCDQEHSVSLTQYLLVERHDLDEGQMDEKYLAKVSD